MARSKKKSKSAKVHSTQKNNIHQSNRQSQNSNVQTGDGGDGGRATCINALSGNNVALPVGVLAALLGGTTGNSDQPGGDQNGGGNQACTAGGGGDGGDAVVVQNQGAANANTGDQTNDGGAGVVQ
jgi:hypothetical protein